MKDYSNQTAKMHSIDEFLRTAPRMFKMTKGQIAGFRSLMKSHNKMWTFDLKEYIPLLKDYLTH